MSQAVWSRVAVHVVLKRGKTVFMIRRASTGFADGCLSFPTGHVHVGETLADAAVRELNEEAGVTALADSLVALGTTFRPGQDDTRVDIFFLATRWQGVPYAAEPHRASESGWFPMEPMPADSVPFVAASLPRLLQGAVIVDNPVLVA